MIKATIEQTEITVLKGLQQLAIYSYRNDVIFLTQHSGRNWLDVEWYGCGWCFQMVTLITFRVNSSNNNGDEEVELIEINWLFTVSINFLNADDRFSRFSV